MHSYCADKAIVFPCHFVYLPCADTNINH